MSKIDTSELQRIITGRVVPHIYSFTTNTLPNYLKVGDTYRPVEERLNEWRKHYRDLQEVSRHKATVNDEVFFRDHAVHDYFIRNGIDQVPFNVSKKVHSKEFFERANKSDVTNAVKDIVNNYQRTCTYNYYNNLKEVVEFHYSRTENFKPRENQQKVLDNFGSAIKKGRDNLLMYAVMRFGKSITSIWCAKKMKAKLTVVVSAKADVKSEWKYTVESHKDFKGYCFIDKTDLKRGVKLSSLYGKKFKTGSGDEEICTNIVLFLTLQDLAGSTETIKNHHKILRDAKVDLLIIDETHFGARAPVLGKILAGVEIDEEEKELLKKDKEDPVDLGTLGKLQPINAEVKIHLSGTPYRILMGSEFAQEDIIAFVQFSDIYEAKLRWGVEHLDDNEWENPYYGFPQMIRFAFNPNESSRRRLAGIPGSKPAELFTPVSTSKKVDYNKFKYEQEVIDLLQVLDGTKNDANMLGLLDNETVKAGKLAQHIVIVLPYRASCDALVRLITKNRELFKNIAEYELLNISGYDHTHKTPEEVKSAIAKAAQIGKKTITFTVNKMLTGSTVPQWDTMIYLKGTASPQEYDQAIFRLQSAWIEKYKNEKGDVIKYDMKPQTLLVDLDPTRLFYLQERKAFTYGANTQDVGNENIEKCIEKELRISPIITLNAERNKLVEVTATLIIDQVRKYASERTITEDVQDIGVDPSLKEIPSIIEFIGKLAELGGKNGLNIRPNEEEGGELDGVALAEVDAKGMYDIPTRTATDGADAKDISSFGKRLRTYYVKILLFAFLSSTKEKSLTGVIENIDANDDNRRIALNLGLKKSNLLLLREYIKPHDLSALDYKIQNSDFRANDDSITSVQHVDIAIHKFGRLSEAEVFTPSAIVNRMYDALNEEFWRKAKDAKVLDIASKSGSFAKGFVGKAIQEGAKIGDIKDNFYSIPTSPAAYEFTRKMYEALGLNVDNIARYFNSFDLIKLNDAQVRNLLSQDKKLSDIRLSDLKLSAKMEERHAKSNMKFTAVVGNPPYQDNAQMQIYTNFYLASKELGDVVSMIFPIGWQEPKTGNKFKKLNKREIKEDSQIVFIDNRQNVFPGISGAEWTNIILWKRGHDNGLDGNQRIFTNGLNPTVTKLLTKKSEVYKPEKIQELAALVLNSPGFISLQTMMTDRKPYGLSSDFLTSPSKYGLPPVLNERVSKSDYRIYGLKNRKQVINYLPKNYPIPKKSKALNRYKVFVGEAWGNWSKGAGLGGAFADVIIANPKDIVTETFTEPGNFKDFDTARKHAKFLMTRFARALLYVNKHSLHSRSSWGAVPVQDYLEPWWSESIEQLEIRLFDKYNVPDDVRNFVLENIQQKTEKNIINY